MSTEEETKEAKAEATAAETDMKKEDKKEDEKKEDAGDDEVVKSVAERLKFFFSDANVRQDMFMRKFLMPYRNKDDDDKKEEEQKEDCSVPIETLLRFNTIKRYTTEPKMVVRAVKEHLSEKLTLKDDDTAIARVKPFTKELIHENIPLSLYVSNLPVKEQERGNRKQTVYDVNMNDIRKLFEVYGEVAIVKMRFKSSAYSDDEHHTDDIKMADDPPKEQGGGSPRKPPRRRFPLGCCMVEFEKLEDHGKAAEDVLTKKDGEDAEPKRKLQLGENTLQVMLLKDYVESVGKRKKKRDRDGDGDDDDNKNREEEDEIEKFTIEWKPGCVVSMKGLPESCDREAILGAVSKVCDIDVDKLKEKKIHADYSRGQKDGAIQFGEPELATKMMENLKSGDAKISDAAVEEVLLLEGDEEKKYWDDYTELRKKYMRERKHHKNNKHNKYNGNKRRKGGQKKYETLQS